jgi:D-ribulokinase
MTDGCAAQVAGGAVTPGQWLSVLGTTLVIKGVTCELLHDPQGRVYCHKHPAGFWLPGGASNTGGEVLERRFAGGGARADRDPPLQFGALDAAAAALTPGRVIAYPLERVGERFPFLSPQARGFMLGTPRSQSEHFLACLEGVAYVERLAYATLAALGEALGDSIIVMGGGARSRSWLQIRADVLGRGLVRPQQTGAAFGAALIAASTTLAPDLVAAVRQAVRYEALIAPRPALADAYAERYASFVAECRRRGYVAET